MSRPFRTCTHTPRADGSPRHVHGTRLCYVEDGCRCRECTAANTREQAARNREQIYGRYDSGLVDAAPVREHLAVLHEAGISLNQVASITGIGRTTLHKIQGTYSIAKPPQARCPRRILTDVLAIEPDPIKYAHPKRPLDGTGVARRLQALVAIGWTQNELAAKLGVRPSNFTILVHGGAMVEAQTVRAVRALYDDLWDQPKEGTFQAATARAVAVKRGWVPPLAWDDDALDDPTKDPATLALKAKGSHVNVNYSEVLYLIDSGVGFGEVLARMNITDLNTLREGLIRRGRRDLADSFQKASPSRRFLQSA